MPSLASRKRGCPSIKANEPRCNPALRVMPSMPAERASCKRTRKVSRGAFMVSFSMQLTKIMPGPRLAAMVLPRWSRVDSAICPRSNCTLDLSVFATLYLYCLSLDLTKFVFKSRSVTVGSMASDMCPIPPRRAASSASSAVEMSTPMPPIIMGTSSCLPNLKQKSFTHFIAVLRFNSRHHITL